jgi:hypothetical protein
MGQLFELMHEDKSIEVMSNEKTHIRQRSKAENPTGMVHLRASQSSELMKQSKSIQVMSKKKTQIHEGPKSGNQTRMALAKGSHPLRSRT